MFADVACLLLKISLKNEKKVKSNNKIIHKFFGGWRSPKSGGLRLARVLQDQAHSQGFRKMGLDPDPKEG